jgi:hypothetical protein
VKASSFCVALAHLVLVISCGSDGSPGSTSRIDPTKKVSALSEAELQTLCKWYNTVGDDVHVTAEQWCASDYQEEDEQTADGCKEYVADCVKDYDGSLPGYDKVDCSSIKAPSKSWGCSASVQEYEDCIRESLHNYWSSITDLSCNSLSNVGQDASDSEACDALASPCQDSPEEWPND